MTGLERHSPHELGYMAVLGRKSILKPRFVCRVALWGQKRGVTKLRRNDSTGRILDRMSTMHETRIVKHQQVAVLPTNIDLKFVCNFLNGTTDLVGNLRTILKCGKVPKLFGKAGE